MALYKKDNNIYDTLAGIEHDGMITFNASPAQMIEWGYEVYVPEPVPHDAESDILGQIDALKAELVETDYIALKSLEGYDCDTLYPGWKESRRALRDRINELELQLESVDIES